MRALLGLAWRCSALIMADRMVVARPPKAGSVYSVYRNLGGGGEWGRRRLTQGRGRGMSGA